MSRLEYSIAGLVMGVMCAIVCVAAILSDDQNAPPVQPTIEATYADGYQAGYIRGVEDGHAAAVKSIGKVLNNAMLKAEVAESQRMQEEEEGDE